MELIINKHYISWIKQLEDNYDNPPKFKKIVENVKNKIHSGCYNRAELLNVWRKLTYGLSETPETIKGCKINIKCLIDNRIEFLNYHHDNEPMNNLLRFGDLRIIQDVFFKFTNVQKLIGFYNENDKKYSLSQDINTDCPVIQCLNLLLQSKNKEEFIDFKLKLEFILYLLKSKFGTKFHFIIKYLMDGKLYYTTPLIQSILSKNNLISKFIANRGGKIDYKLNEPLCKRCESSYYNFFEASSVETTILNYYKVNLPVQYQSLINYQASQLKTLKNKNENNNKTKGIIKRRKNENRQKRLEQIISLNQPSLSFNGNIQNVKQRIEFNKQKEVLLMNPLNETTKTKIKYFWANIGSNSSNSNSSNSNSSNSNPYVVVGGVGGSGTRLISSILATLGLNIGSDLNEAYDNLSYSLLFKHLGIKKEDFDYDSHFNLLEKSILGQPYSMTEKEKLIVDTLSEHGRPGHPRPWIKERAENIIKISKYGSINNEYLKKIPKISNQPLKGKWGWKEPNSHTILDKLDSSTKFIMVVRNGLDMAFSTNQNQLRLWGPYVLPDKYKKYDKQGNIKYTPEASLNYWTLVHKRVLELGKKRGKHFLMINFDDMCLHPNKWLTILCDFLEINTNIVPELLPQVVYQSEGIGRFKKHDLSRFDNMDIKFVKEMGFDTEKESSMTKKNNSNGIRMTRKMKSVRFNNYVQYQRDYPYVVVGAVGGSGTRLIAGMLYALGLNIGTNLNTALDNNVFVYLFRRKEVLELSNKDFDTYLDIMTKSFGVKSGMSEKEETIINELSNTLGQQLTIGWLKRQSKIIKRMIQYGSENIVTPEIKKVLGNIVTDIPLKNKPLENKWGWKAPNSHIIMLRLHKAYSKMKYIMVIRNGLDMAFSDNKNQLELWGPLLFDKKELTPGWTESPRLALKYWCISYRRIFEESKKMGKQFYLLKYENMCENPLVETENLLKFLQVPYDDIMVKALASSVKKPEGIGRYKNEDLSQLDNEDIAFVKSLGYHI